MVCKREFFLEGLFCFLHRRSHGYKATRTWGPYLSSFQGVVTCNPFTMSFLSHWHFKADFHPLQIAACILFISNDENSPNAHEASRKGRNVLLIKSQMGWELQTGYL